MFCANCGAKLSEAARFCQECGAAVRSPAAGGPVTAGSAAVGAPGPEAGKSKAPKAVRTFGTPAMIAAVVLAGIGAALSLAALSAYMRSMRTDVLITVYNGITVVVALLSLVSCLLLKKKPVFSFLPVCLLAAMDFLTFRQGLYHLQRPVEAFIYAYSAPNIGDLMDTAVRIVMPNAAALYAIAVFMKGKERKILSGLAAALFCLSFGLLVPLLGEMPAYWSEYVPAQEAFATPDLHTSAAWLAIGVRLVSCLCFAVVAAGSIRCGDEAFRLRRSPRQEKTPAAVSGFAPNGFVPQTVGYYAPVNPPAADDAPSGGFGVLCFLVPVIGLVLYLVWKDQYPRRAKSCGKGALAGAIAWPILMILLYVAAYFAVLYLLR